MLSFATEAKDIVDIIDEESGNIDDVIWSIMDFNYTSMTLLVLPLLENHVFWSESVCIASQLWCIYFHSDLFLFVCSLTGHGRKTGTNIHGALKRVEERMSIFKRNNNQFNETQNIIIIATDGDNTRRHCFNAVYITLSLNM